MSPIPEDIDKAIHGLFQQIKPVAHLDAKALENDAVLFESGFGAAADKSSWLCEEGDHGGIPCFK